MTKDLIDAIRERRSVRRFEDAEIPEATLGRILECARLAPSAGNRQPWLFLVVRNRELKQRLVEAALGQTFIAQAPVAIVVCADVPRSTERYGERGRTLYCLQDTAAAIEHILLAANAFGLGSCWVGAFDEDKVARIFGLDQKVHRPVAIIPLGTPAESPSPRPRRSIDEIVMVYD